MEMIANSKQCVKDKRSWESFETLCPNRIREDQKDYHAPNPKDVLW